jgi:hypothetical protein
MCLLYEFLTLAGLRLMQNVLQGAWKLRQNHIMLLYCMLPTTAELGHLYYHRPGF